MKSVVVEGNVPLIGTVNVSGSNFSSLCIIYAALYSNEDVIIDNVPQVPYIQDNIDIIKSTGATIKWLATNTLLVNGSTIDSYKIPLKDLKKLRSMYLITGVLLYRFGKAYLPKIPQEVTKYNPINRLIETWDSLGIIYHEDDNYYMISGENFKSGIVNFKYISNIASAHALILTACLQGSTIIYNLSEDPDLDDLINFLKAMGVQIDTSDSTKIIVTGTNVFKGNNWVVTTDKNEIVFFIISTLMTNGNILIKPVIREHLTSFTYFLMQIGARFEFEDNGLKVWSSGEYFKPISTNISHYPALLSDWQSLITLLLCKAQGESFIQDYVYTNRFDFIKDLNRMGSKIDLLKASDIGAEFISHDDSLMSISQDEPNSVLRIKGPAKLKGEKIDITDYKYGTVLLLAAIAAEGKSFISGFDRVDYINDDIVEKLKNLGAKIRYVSID